MFALSQSLQDTHFKKAYGSALMADFVFIISLQKKIVFKQKNLNVRN